jgi:hypothetical protein
MALPTHFRPERHSWNQRCIGEDGRGSDLTWLQLTAGTDQAAEVPARTGG